MDFLAELKRFIYLFSFSICIGLLSQSVHAQTQVYYGAGEFERAIAHVGEYKGIERIFTYDTTLRATNELTSAPTRNSNVGSTLTFPNTIWSRTYVLKTLETGATFTFDDDEGGGNLPSFDNALSVGDIDNYENDDWSVRASEPITAFGVLLKNSGVGVESLTLHDEFGVLLETVSITTSNSISQFIGVVTDFEFYEVRFDEDSGGDDIAIANLRFPTKDGTINRYRDHYGVATDMTPDAKTAVVGAQGGFSTGLVFVHDLNLKRATDFGLDDDRWGVSGVLASPDGEDLDKFGNDVAISADGNTVVVAAPMHNLVLPNNSVLENAGAAYVFHRDQGGRNNWGLVKKLSSLDRRSGADAAVDDRFAQSIDIDDAGEKIIIGVPYSSVIGSNNGVAYEFRKNQGGENNWGYVRDLNGSGQPNDRCGFSVAVSGDGKWYAVGCPYAESEVISIQRNDGRIAFFSENGGRNTSLEINPYYQNLLLGESVALNYDGTVVSASTNQNRLLIYRRTSVTDTSWPNKQLLGGDGVATRFSKTISVSGDGKTVMTGSYLYDGVGTDSGRASVFIRTAASFFNTIPIVINGAEARQNLGNGVALNFDGTQAIIGSPKYNSVSTGLEGEAQQFQFTTNWQPISSLMQDAISEVDDELCVPIKAQNGRVALICL